MLDWAYAGFYPKIFERSSQLITQRPEDNKVILDQRVSERDLIQDNLVIKAWWNNERLCL